MASDSLPPTGFVLRFSLGGNRRPSGSILVFRDGRIENRGVGFVGSPAPTHGWVSSRTVEQALELAHSVLSAPRPDLRGLQDASHSLSLEIVVDGAARSADFVWERMSNYDAHHDPVEGAQALEDFNALFALLETFERASRSTTS